MNYSIIKEMLVNNRCSDENIPTSKKFKTVLKKIEEIEEKIKKLLPEDEREKLMWDYSLLQGELGSEVESSSFAEGFKIGLLIGAEVFSEAHNNNE